MNTLAQQFATEYARGIVPQMLASIDKVRRNSAWIARAALTVTTPHQVLYIAGLSHGAGLVDVISAWCFAILIPAITDLGMLTMLRITQTAGMHQRARRRALVVLALLVAESATVNAIAPGHAVFRVLVAFAAVVLALVEWVHAAVAPDFAAMEQHEQQANAQLVDDDAEQRRAARRERDRARRAAKRQAERATAEAEAERKAAAAQRRRLARQTRQLEQQFAAESAPVSPAPWDSRAYL